jgi:hypothetical protein
VLGEYLGLPIETMTIEFGFYFAQSSVTRFTRLRSPCVPIVRSGTLTR